MKKGIFIISGVFLAFVVGALLFMQKPQTGSKNETSPTPSPTASSEGVSAEGEVREIQVVGNEYSFTPSSISVEKREKIALTFRNAGRLPHNLTIKELGVSTKTIGQGASDSVEFIAEEAGIFTFYCSIGNHQSLGMEGSLEVK